MKRTLTRIAAAGLAFFAMSGAANALVIEFDSIITGYMPNSGTSPWLTATITNTTNAAGVNGVNIVFSTSVVNPEFITAIYFSYPGGSNCSPGTSPAGTGPFQLCHTFAPSLQWDGPTSAAMFFGGYSEGGFGFNRNGWLAAAHVQGIQPDCSGWIGAGRTTVDNGSGICGQSVPEPGTLGLLGLGLAGLGFGLRRRNKA